MITSYSAAHIIVRATGREEHRMRERGLLNPRTLRGSLEVSRTALNKRRENPTIAYLDFYASDSMVSLTRGDARAAHTKVIATREKKGGSLFYMIMNMRTGG